MDAADAAGVEGVPFVTLTSILLLPQSLDISVYIPILQSQSARAMSEEADYRRTKPILAILGPEGTYTHQVRTRWTKHRISIFIHASGGVPLLWR